MTKIKSKLMLASLNTATNDILYTFEFTIPRIILPEVLTHRVLSRNTASSRAIPSKRQRRRVIDDPFIPSYLGANQKGMQPGEELLGWKRWLAEKIWLYSRYPNVMAGWALDKLGVHKGIVNRCYETHTWTKQLVSCTDINNFLLLRTHEAAEPHFQELARQVKYQVESVRHALLGAPCPLLNTDFAEGVSAYQRLGVGEWHLPYISKEEKANFNPDECCKISTARCARVSYDMPDTGIKSTVNQDLALYERLAGSTPKHLSPLEHPAQAMISSRRFGNYTGWLQYRKLIDGESGE